MKYMGSKSRISKEILPIILKDRKEDQFDVEPFAGGMNVICDVTGNRIANDVHLYLIEMWKELCYNGWIPRKYIRIEYKKIREFKDSFPPYEVGWVGFNCSYSGIWFGGEIKTKTGKLRDYQNEAIKNVKKQIPKMNGVIFSNKHYYDLDLPLNSIVYCDPPYEGTSGYKVDVFNHSLFWDWVRSISKQGHIVFVSEYKAPDDFECVW